MYPPRAFPKGSAHSSCQFHSAGIPRGRKYCSSLPESVVGRGGDLQGIKMVLLGSSCGTGSSGNFQALPGMAGGKWESQRDRAVGIGEQSSPHPLCAAKMVRKSGISPGNSQWLLVFHGINIGKASATIESHHSLALPRPPCPQVPHPGGSGVSNPAQCDIPNCPQTAPGLSKSMAQQPLEYSGPIRADFGPRSPPAQPQF